jgi:hypothetical protein
MDSFGSEEGSVSPSIGVFGSKQQVIDVCLAQMAKDAADLAVCENGLVSQVFVNPNHDGGGTGRRWKCVQMPTWPFRPPNTT